MDRSASQPAATPREWWWIFDPRISLRAAVGLTAGGSTLLLVLLITSIASGSLHRSLEAQLGGNFETLAVQVADKIDRTIYERYRTLQLAANLGTLRAPDVSPADRRRVLDSLQESSPDFAWIGLADATGRILAATRGQSEGAPMGDRSWFLLGRERSYAGEPREVSNAPRGAMASDDGGGARVFELAVPVVGTQGEPAGVLGAQVRWAWTREVQLSVVSEAAGRELIGVTLYRANKEILLDSGGSGWTQPPDAPAITDPRRARGTLIEDTAGGTRYLTGFARSRGFREYRGLGWLATVRQPVERVFAPVDALKRSMMRWGFLLVAGVSTGSWIVAGRMVRRMRTIAAAATRIREGDILTVLPRPRGDSELAQMCAALDDMVDDFRAKQETLAAKNAQLAAEARERDGAKR
jgi:hypothetical protein